MLKTVANNTKVVELLRRAIKRLSRAELTVIVITVAGF
jgi:hypothetical protein